MRYIDLWCPEEDVELYIIMFKYRHLLIFKNIKAVPKVVLICA
jgi:hypothetical protein